MFIAESVASLHSYMQLQTVSESLSVGLVPTMGALHEGHLSLVRRAKEVCDFVVCSIFVNPIQFNNEDDFLKYPNTLAQDLALLETEGCDLVFTPNSTEIYSQKPILSMSFGHLEHVLEGAFRPGHFSGVGIVVSKLFNLVKPDHAFFGLKDLQQCAVVKMLVRDLSFSIKLHLMPTLREANGLAMSSRNKRLSANGRAKAAVIYESLLLAKQEIENNTLLSDVKTKALQHISNVPEIELEYFEFVNFESFEIINDFPTEKTAICLACYLEGVRLIDNVLV